MGVNANINVFGWRKPTIEITLVAGGDLLANTTHYIAAFMGYTASVWSQAGGALCDMQTIDTTDTHRSIQISHKTYRDLTNFADNGDNRTLVTSERHCFSMIVGKEDTIKIDSGTYAGTWTVEWVDYDNFIINTPYVDNVAIQGYSDSVFYNATTNDPRSFANGMVYFISTLDPYNSYGVIDNISIWSKRAPYGDYIENPVIFTTYPAQQGWRYSAHPVQCSFNVGPYKILEDYGTIHIEILGSVTPEEVFAEVQASGFIYNFGHYDTGTDQQPQLTLIGSMKTDGGDIYIENTTVVVSGEIFDRAGLSENIVFDNCGINFLISPYAFATNFTANNSVVYCNADDLTFSGFIKGEYVIIYGTLNATYTNVDVPNQSGTNLAPPGGAFNYGIVQKKEFRSLYERNQIYQSSYNRVSYEDCIFHKPLYWVMSTSQDVFEPDIYWLENCVFEKGYNTGGWHIRNYQYEPTSLTILKGLNVDTPNDNNIKKIITLSTLGHIIWRFYRSINIHVQNEGVDLENVNINIIDDQGEIYNGQTDVNGEAYLEVIEQVTDHDGRNAAYPNWDGAEDTYHKNFVITVSKNGYQSISLSKEILDEQNIDIVLLKNVQHAIIKKASANHDRIELNRVGDKINYGRT